MKKLLPTILLSPFLMITLYWVIDKYIYFLFNIQDHTGASMISFMLTILVTGGIVGATVSKYY